ncbi:MAG: hypothetical protein KKE93_01740 [Nanoarchaeota archaeon]|nr:hypothetical protein [Nanoarchaeota archaeon]
MTTLIITQSGPNTTIDKLVSPESEDIPDDKHIWIHLSGQIDWANEGCGFIYRNFRGAKKTLGEALDHLYGVLNFFGGEWKLEKSEPNYISYTRGNGRESIVRYDLEWQSVFDMNH